MDAKTLRALKGSIKKWEKIVDGTGVDKRGDNCPLCQLFCVRSTHRWCYGCPVYETTRNSNCNETPYYAVLHSMVYDKEKGGFRAKSVKSKILAQKELDFLKSLLPKKGGKK